MKQARVLGGLIAAAVTVACPLASATEPEAERLFREGRALMLEGRLAEACPKIAESHRIEPRVGTLLNLAACHEQDGKVAAAWVEYQKALTASRAEGHTERERFARERIDVLEPRVPWLTLSVPEGSGTQPLEIALDGAPIAPVAWGKEMPVDPGPHVVSVVAPKIEPFEERFELHESEHKTVVVVLGPKAPPSQDSRLMPLIVEPPIRPTRPVTTANTTNKTMRDTGFVTGGLGLVSLGAGAFFALRASALKDDFEQQLSAYPGSRAGVERARSDLQTSTMVADVTIVGGLVALGAGLVLVLTSGPSSPSRPASTTGRGVTWRPVVGPTSWMLGRSF